MISKDSWFMTLAYLTATRSKDRRTKVGAVVVGFNDEVRATGYNGFPRGCNDFVESRHEKPEKYYWTEHAERNATFNAARVGVSLDGCTIYVPGCPCADCARAIIQSGIKKVVIHKKFQENWSEKWMENAKRSIEMFDECGVEYVEWSGDLVDLAVTQNGETKCL
jgi:dCMP deaminase